MRRQWWYEKDCVCVFFSLFSLHRFQSPSVWVAFGTSSPVALSIFIIFHVPTNKLRINVISVCRVSPTWRAPKKYGQKYQHLFGFTVVPGEHREGETERERKRSRSREYCSYNGCAGLVLSVIELQELQETSLSRQRYRIRHTVGCRLLAAHYTHAHTQTYERTQKNEIIFGLAYAPKMYAPYYSTEMYCMSLFCCIQYTIIK